MIGYFRKGLTEGCFGFLLLVWGIIMPCVSKADFHYELPNGVRSYNLSWWSKCRHGWGMVLESADGMKLWLKFENVEKMDVISSRPAVRLSVAVGKEIDLPEPGDFRECAVLTDGIDPTGGFNIWRVRSDGSRIHVKGGNHGLKDVVTLESLDGELRSYGFFSLRGDGLTVDNVSFEEEGCEINENDMMEAASVDGRLNSPRDPLEGVWGVYDRNLNESLLRLGGDYRLGVLREGRRYRIIYLEGAVTESGRWKKGMTKGWLTPTGWEDVWNLIWIDSSGKVMSRDLKAQRTEDDVLELQFPYQDSRLRLRRMKPSPAP